MSISCLLKKCETILFVLSVFVIIVWLFLSITNYREGWEFPILLPLLYCVLKLRRISNDNQKNKRALGIDVVKESNEE